MKRSACGLSIVFVLGIAINPLFAQESGGGGALYQANCAICHGAELYGGNAQSLVDAVWQFGDKESYKRRNIQYGIVDIGMPAFGEVLSDGQISQIIKFLDESEDASGAVKPPPPEKLQTLDYDVDVEIWVEGLEIPWGITFLTDERTLVTERAGRLRVIENGELLPDPVSGTPEVEEGGQGGLMDVAADPDYADNGWIYLAYSHALSDAPFENRTVAMTRLVRGRLKDNAWVDQQVVYEAPHETYRETRHHYGCRIVFDPEGHLYFSIGERGTASHAQDLSRPNGKVHRINRDGTIPDDNPFVGRDGALPSIFTYGNRNPQGLSVHPVTGQVWETEHGPMGGDELNLLGAGKNYGWPEITYGRNYNGDIVSEFWEKPGMEQAVLYWRPSTGVCGMDFVRGDLFPRWKNHLLVASLKYEDLRLLEIQDGRVLHQEVLLKNAGRVRDVACGPDGAIYVILNSPGVVLRFTRSEPGGFFS